MLRTPAGVMLIDAGIGPRTVGKRLNGTGVEIGEVAAVCLTHLDRDHFNLSWVNHVVGRKLAVFCHRSRVKDLAQLAGNPAFSERLIPFGEAPFSPLPGVNFHGIDLAHDVEGSHGFVIEGFGQRAGFATDLGRVPPHLIERFAPVDLLAMESNYDPEMQQASGRPWFLKQRIMGGRGHLSNEQAFAAVRAILDRCHRERGRLPGHIVLLHRSQQCNCPKRVRQLFEQDARIAARLTLAEQDQRTGWLGAKKSDVGEQLLLGWS